MDASIFVSLQAFSLIECRFVFFLLAVLCDGQCQGFSEWLTMRRKMPSNQSSANKIRYITRLAILRIGIDVGGRFS